MSRTPHISDIDKAHFLVKELSILRKMEKALEEGQAKRPLICLKTKRQPAEKMPSRPRGLDWINWASGNEENPDAQLIAFLHPDFFKTAINAQILEIEQCLAELGYTV